MIEESGIPGVEVKCVDIGRNTNWRRQLSGLIPDAEETKAMGSEED